MIPAFERENRIRELIQLFVREHDAEKLKILAAELQRLLTLEGTLPKIWRECNPTQHVAVINLSGRLNSSLAAMECASFYSTALSAAIRFVSGWIRKAK